MHLICVSVVATERQQSHHLSQYVQSGFFHQLFFFFVNSVHLCISWYLLLLQAVLCKIQALDKRGRNEQTLMNYLPPLSTSPALPFPSPPHHTPACLALESRKDPCTPRGAVLLHLFPNYQMYESRHQSRLKSPLMPIPDMICVKRERRLCATFLVSIKHWHRPSTGASDCCCFPNTKWLARPEQSLH